MTVEEASEWDPVSDSLSSGDAGMNSFNANPVVTGIGDRLLGLGLSGSKELRNAVFRSWEFRLASILSGVNGGNGTAITSLLVLLFVSVEGCGVWEDREVSMDESIGLGPHVLGVGGVTIPAE